LALSTRGRNLDSNSAPMLKLPLLFACLLFGISAVAQNQRKIDSLKNVLKVLEENMAITNARITEVKHELATLQPASKTKPTYCSTYVQRELDRMTGKTVFTAPKESVAVLKGPKGLRMYWSLSDDSARINLQLMLEGISCIDTKESINVQFSDGTRKDFANSNQYNCEGRASVSLVRHFDFEQLDLFALKEVSVVRVWAGNDFVEVDLTKENATTIRRSLICLREFKQMPSGGH
jgi:hypothetical protein